MNKQDLGNLIAELQSAHDNMSEDSEFDIGACDTNDNCYDVSYTVNRMDLNENCENTDGKPYPAELMISLDEGYEIHFNREED